MKLRVVTPEQVLVEAEVRSLRFPGADGLFGVLPRHATMVSLAEPGLLAATAADGQALEYVIHEGFVEVRDDRITVLTRSAESPAAIDLARARQAAERARERMRSRSADVDLVRAVAALRRALARERYARRPL